MLKRNDGQKSLSCPTNHLEPVQYLLKHHTVVAGRLPTIEKMWFLIGDQPVAATANLMFQGH